MTPVLVHVEINKISRVSPYRNTRAVQHRESIALAMWAEYERRPARCNHRGMRLA